MSLWKVIYRAFHLVKWHLLTEDSCGNLFSYTRSYLVLFLQGLYLVFCIFCVLTSLLYLHTCTASPLLALFLVIVPAPSLFLEFLHSLISPVFLHLTSSPHYFSLYFSPVFNSVFMELSVVCFPVHLVLFPYSCRCVSLFLSCFSAPE